MVRAMCGTHDHLDPLLFLLIFRLMSVSAKGSNVTGEDLFETLIKDGEMNEKRLHGTLEICTWKISGFCKQRLHSRQK